MFVTREWRDDAEAMRRFGLALVRDDRLICDDASAAALVDKLLRQASLTSIRSLAADPRPARARAFAQFVRLYRRHLRRLAVDETDGVWLEASAPLKRANRSAACAVRSLPLELRETLLLVVLAGFSHAEAAETLNLPLAAVVDRLGRARARISAHMGAEIDSPPQQVWRRGAHLRIVK